MVVPFLSVLPKLSVRFLACDESSHISETGCQIHERLSGLALMHLHHDHEIDGDKSVQFCNQTQEEDVPRLYGSFMSRIQVNSKLPRNYNVQPPLGGQSVGEK